MVVELSVREYIARNYGVNDCVANTTGDALGLACMTDTLATPFPAGYTKDALCSEEILTWAYESTGWCISAPPPTQAEIRVSSSPLNARVTIDGVYVGNAPGVFTVSVGTHTLNISLSGYQDWEESRALVADQVWVVDASLIPISPPSGGVPQEVREYIATNYGSGGCIVDTTGDALGLACMTDTLVTPLPAGYTKDALCSEEILTWAYSSVGWCTEAPQPTEEAYIFVNSTPPGARIHIDDVYMGDLTPSNSDHVVVPGYHTVKLTLSNHEDWEEGGSIGINGRWDVEASLVPLEPVWQVEFVAPQVSGEIVVAECTIPPTVMLGREERFGIRVKNTGSDARFMIDLAFTGPASYMASSEWLDVTAGSSRTISVYFTAPATASLGTYTVTASLYAQG